MPIRFYNTLTQKVEDFAPADGKTVRMYVCGPTVYNYAHIGNLRTFTFQDLLRRWLRARGLNTLHVMNITDVDDKIIRNAVQQHITIRDYTAPYEKAFLEDMDTLRLQRPEKLVRATDHIDEMVSLIQSLTEKGITYESDGSVYYRIAKFPEYGKLSHNDFGGMIAGARVDVDEYEKENARDFVLWKQKKEGEPSWDTPIGDGRPGWHIECSAMAMKYLGETLDIHAGGIDLTFPHHENEIAQSEAVTGKPFARFWIHAEHLIVEGQKMSKSLGNYYTLRDVIGMGYQPEAVRYLLASVPYRNKLNFTFEGLKGAATSIERLRNFELRLKTDKFPSAANDAQIADGDTPDAAHGSGPAPANAPAPTGDSAATSLAANPQAADASADAAHRPGPAPASLTATAPAADASAAATDSAHRSGPAPAANTRTAAALARFEEAMDDDLNTASALGVIFEYIRETNTAMDSGAFRAENVAPALALLARFDEVFDVLKPAVAAGALSDAEIDALAAERVAAKKARDFARADAIRADLLEKGVILEDTKEGTRWKRK